MSTIFLHIGMHKTGSTAIQSAFFSYDDGITKYADLGYENHSIPVYTAFSRHYLGYHIWKAQGLSDNEVEAIRQKSLEMISRSVSEVSNKNLIFSGEDISLLSPKEINSLRIILEGSGREIKVIVYVREPVSFLTSNLQEDIKSGTNPKLPQPPRYKDRIEGFIKTFGRDNVIIKGYRRDQLYKGDVVEDFARLVGVDCPNRPRSENASLSTEGVKVACIVNDLISRFGESKHIRAARTQMIGHLQELLPGRFDLPYEYISGQIDWEDVNWLRATSGINFSRTRADNPNFSEDQLYSFLKSPESSTTSQIREYLISHCDIKSPPVDPRFLIARYFMSFLAHDINSFKFDPEVYLRLHPDVKKARVDPYRHYLEHGIFEGRRIK